MKMIEEGWIGMRAVAIGLCFFSALGASPAARAQDVPVPIYKVDPFWPKQLPNKWSTQQFVDIYVSAGDHVWGINRSVGATPFELGAAMNPPQGDCCVLGPEIVEFDADGNVHKAWGGPKYVPGWPARIQTLTVDREENVWLSGTWPGDSVIKFSSDGKVLWDLGHRSAKSSVVGTTEEMRGKAQNNQQTDTFFGGLTPLTSMRTLAKCT